MRHGKKFNHLSRKNGHRKALLRNLSISLVKYKRIKEAVTEMFTNIDSKIANRPGGYLRIVRLGFRPSDAAEVAMIELVDFNIVALNAANDAAESDKKRTRRGRKKKSDETSSEEINETVKPEDTELNVQNDSVETENKDNTAE